MNRILSLQFYLVSNSSPGPWPGALPLQLRDPNYGNGDTNTFCKRMFEQFTEYLTGWKICQLPLSFEGSKLFSFRWGLRPLTPWPGALPLGPARGSAPRPPPLGAPPQTPATTPPLQTPWPRHWLEPAFVGQLGAGVSVSASFQCWYTCNIYSANKCTMSQCHVSG